MSKAPISKDKSGSKHAIAWALYIYIYIYASSAEDLFACFIGIFGGLSASSGKLGLTQKKDALGGLQRISS